jgi:CRP/FNR family transcriptional regulator
MSPVPQLLRKFPLLKDLSPETHNALHCSLIPRSFEPGQCLVHEALPAEVCYFINTGAVRVFRTNLEGRVQVLARLGPGEPVNIISLLKKEPQNHATVEALTDVDALALIKSDFYPLLENYPDFTSALLQAFAERLAGMTDLAAGLSLLTVRARLAGFLIQLAEKPQIAGGWTQDEIAAQIGTVRDVVGRILRKMESEAVIRRDRDRIILLDREKLIREAEWRSDES